MTKIDFDMFAVKKEEPVSGGAISGALAELMSNDPQLQSVIAMLKTVYEKNSRENIWWVSNGDWSMHELLLEILNLKGLSDVYISSYAMSETSARVLAQLKSAGKISKLYTLLDNRVDTRTAGSLQIIKSISDKCVLVDTHAKVTVVKSYYDPITVVGSANYTENKRYEAGIISCSDEAAEMQLRWMQKALNDGIQQ